MARTSEETLSTSCGRPFSLARYISPSNSSRTGQKSFSKASRLENMAFSPCREDAMQFTNGRLTNPSGNRTGAIEFASRIGTAVTGGYSAAIGGDEDRQPEAGEVMQRLVDADQRPEPGVLEVDVEGRGTKPLGAVDDDVNDEIDHGQKPEFRRDNQDQQQSDRQMHQAMRQ